MIKAYRAQGEQTEQLKRYTGCVSPADYTT